MKPEELEAIEMGEKPQTHKEPLSPAKTYKEWVKSKDSEKRLKRKLIQQAQEDVRNELL